MIPAVLITALIHGSYDFLLDPSVIDTDWGYLALILAVLCLVLNFYNFYFMSKARKKPFYTDPLFMVDESEKEDRK